MGSIGTNKQTKFKVWLRQGSKVETTKHTGVKPLSQIIGNLFCFTI
jgi:hypothetical protein